MNKTLLGVLITAVALVAIGGVYAINNRDSGSSSSAGSNMSPTETPGSPKAEKHDGPADNHTSKADKNAVVETDKVTMQDFAFVPAKIKVKKGATVTWTNQDSASHNVAPDEPSASFNEGDLIGKGENYSFKFDTVGTFSYYCSPHPYMKASVEVVE